MRRSDRSDVGCTHTDECPLFPLLRASLYRWRDYYCDSDDRWRDCARYKLALTGRPVPISLLPNGRDAQHLRDEAEAIQAAAEVRQAPKQTPPARSDFGSSHTTAQFEQVSATTPEPAWPAEPPPPNSQSRQSPPARSPRAAQREQRAKRGWWTRLAEWMRGPA
jgi:hypothetical protein